MSRKGDPTSGDVPTACRKARRSDRFLTRWFFGNSLVAGFFALAWLVLRSGAKPSRLAYPCQQTAFSAASLAFGAPLVAAVVSARRHVAAGVRRPAAVASLVIVAVIGLAIAGILSGVGAAPVAVLEPDAAYRAQLFHVAACPQNPVGDHFPGLDRLVRMMGEKGLKIYRSTTSDLLSGPEGIVGEDDVVIIKINYQWAERGGSNTDVLRGLIRLLVDHPDGFSGEIVIAENTQFASSDAFDRASNNAQNTTQSPRDVADHFAALGHQVSVFDWTAIRYTPVDEYSDGDAVDGYVVYDFDVALNGRISYPKFQAASGTFVSMRDGIWDPVASTYDRDRLKVINLPVLKSHHGTYGVTACTKNYMGLVTGVLDTNSHNAIRFGVLGAVMAEIGPPDLNLLDCIWINADPFTGPSTSYAGATRRDELVASTDPIATDIWAATNILIPAFIANGFLPPWPNPDATPDDPASDFRVYLDRSMTALLAAGYDTTNDLAMIDVHSEDLAQLIFTDGFEFGSTVEWSGVVPGS